MSILINGLDISKKIKEEVRVEVEQLTQKGHRTPCLAVVLIGENPASISYVKGKEKTCIEAGMKSVTLRYPDTITQIELLRVIQNLNIDNTVDGILVQMPIPKHINPDIITDAVSIEKDIDGFHSMNIGKLQRKQECFVPCTPYGVMELLKEIQYDVSGKHAVVLGRSNLVGKPLAQLLLNADATVTICHSKTKDLKSITRQADILVAAIGVMGFVKADMVKDGAVVIDVGINKGEDGKLYGDVDFESVESKSSYITPVPKGVGPMTIAMLMKNTLKAYKIREKITC